MRTVENIPINDPSSKFYRNLHTEWSLIISFGKARISMLESWPIGSFPFLFRILHLNDSVFDLEISIILFRNFSLNLSSSLSFICTFCFPHFGGLFLSHFVLYLLVLCCDHQTSKWFETCTISFAFSPSSIQSQANGIHFVIVRVTIYYLVCHSILKLK